jgi:hypothetical protein
MAVRTAGKGDARMALHRRIERRLRDQNRTAGLNPAASSRLSSDARMPLVCQCSKFGAKNAGKVCALPDHMFARYRRKWRLGPCRRPLFRIRSSAFERRMLFVAFPDVAPDA